MKKYVILLLVLSLLCVLSACGGEELTMQELVEANRTETLLKTYDSVYLHSQINGEFNTEYYQTGDFSYERNPDWAMYMEDNSCFYCIDGVYSRLAFLAEDGISDNVAYRAEAYGTLALDENSLKEKIRSVTESEGRITVVSELNKRDLRELLGDSVKSYRCEYVFDAESYALLEAVTTVSDKNGSGYEFSFECAYNAPMPEAVQPFVDYSLQTGELRTVTVVFNAGTENEKSASVQGPKGLSVGLSLPAGSEKRFTLYTDAALTEPVTELDYNSDCTVYLVWDN